MKFRITIKKNLKEIFPENELSIIYKKNNIQFEGDKPLYQWENKLKEKFFLLGDIVGIRVKGKIISEIKDFKLFENHDKISLVEGRFVIIKINEKNELSVWADQFGRSDIYWCQNKRSTFFITSNKRLVPSKVDIGKIDPNGLAQILTIYGGRPLKKNTLRENLNRVGVNEKLSIIRGKLILQEKTFEPLTTFPKDDLSKLNQYTDIFIEAVRARASKSQNIIFLSSGWDSTSILATLCHLFNKSKIECIIGRMRYSNRSGIINQFELDRAHKIAKYYDVKLHIVELDYTENASKFTEEISPGLIEKEFSNLTGYNHWLLAKGASKIAKTGAVVFAGEISDGAHNLGFSQYFSIFHPASHAFREYSDKMASYLFGPTFLMQLMSGNYKEDPVWKIFMEYHDKTKFDKIETDKIKITSQLIETFFLSGGRIPLYSKDNCKILTTKGREQFLLNGKSTYLDKFIGKINENNLYAHYLFLYNSFHWQGGTVATLEDCCEAFGLKCRLPFLDKSLIDFLSQMPESWGRGLDINNTKYPLKWMLTHKIDYPLHYQTGPHSYLYDVNPSFSHIDEIVNASSFTELYRKALSDKGYLNHFDSDYFNLDYINKIVNKYISGNDVKGQELIDILNLGNLLIQGHFN